MIKKNRAFTLTEIIIVIVIIGLMAAFALPNYMKAVAKTDERSAIANLMTIRAALKMYLTTSTIPATDWLDAEAINNALGLSIVDPSMTYYCIDWVVATGAFNQCGAIKVGVWALHFHSQIHNGDQSIHCNTNLGPCPSCPETPGDCG